MNLLEKHHISSRSFSRAITEVMNLNATMARRLLKDLVDEPIEPPGNVIEVKLAAAYLVQLEVKKVIESKKTESLLPFSILDYKEALEYAREQKDKRKGLDDTNEDESNESSHGGTFSIVKEFFFDHQHLSAKEASKILSEDYNLSESTAKVYWYKILKLRKQGDL